MKNDKDRYWDCLDQAMEASHGGRIDEALAWLDEALKAHPAGAEAHNGRGEILWDEGRLDEALYEFGRAAPTVAQHLAEQPYMLGETFTAADVLVGHTLMWAKLFGVPLGSDVLEGYVQRLVTRPAYLRVMAG